MFKIIDKTIHITRGDIASFNLSAHVGETQYVFQEGDIVRFRIIKSKSNETLLSKDIEAVAGETSVEINLLPEDTRLDEVTNKVKEYWYEIELNPDTVPQTIIGYDTKGAKILNVYPEGVDINA